MKQYWGGRKELRTVRGQLKFFGHVIRREGLENFVVAGTVEGSRGGGKLSKMWMNL